MSKKQNEDWVMALFMLISWASPKLKHRPWNCPLNCTFCFERAIIVRPKLSACSNLGCRAGFIIMLLSSAFKFNDIRLNLTPQDANMMVTMLMPIAKMYKCVERGLSKVIPLWKNMPSLTYRVCHEHLNILLIPVMIKILTKFLEHKKSCAQTSIKSYQTLSYLRNNMRSPLLQIPENIHDMIDCERRVLNTIKFVIDGNPPPENCDMFRSRAEQQKEKDTSPKGHYISSAFDEYMIGAMAVCHLFPNLLDKVKDPIESCVVKNTIKNPMFDQNLVEMICQFIPQEPNKIRLRELVKFVQMILDNCSDKLCDVGVNKTCVSIAQVCKSL